MKTGRSFRGVRPVLVAALSIALVFITGVALADALVVVSLRGSDGKPVEGSVTLTAVSGKGEPRSCHTQQGTCRIAGVPGGLYTVTVKPASGSPPPPRKAMIPPSGKVDLFVSTGGKGK
jgi:hypothetical protein